MAEIFIPTLHTFAMDNLFTGSLGEFRFRVEPSVVNSVANPKEVDMEKSSLHAWFWHGPFCYEKSTMEGEKTFPMSEEGRAQLLDWLQKNV